MSNLFVDKLLGPKASTIKTVEKKAASIPQPNARGDIDGAIGQALSKQRELIDRKSEGGAPQQPPQTRVKPESGTSVGPDSSRMRSNAETRSGQQQAPASVTQSRLGDALAAPDKQSRSSPEVTSQRDPGNNIPALKSGGQETSGQDFAVRTPVADHGQPLNRQPIDHAGAPKDAAQAQRVQTQVPSATQLSRHQQGDISRPAVTAAQQHLAQKTSVAAPAAQTAGGSAIRRQDDAPAQSRTVTGGQARALIAAAAAQTDGRKLPTQQGLGRTTLLAAAEVQSAAPQRVSRAAELIAQKKAEMSSGATVARKAKTPIEAAPVANFGGKTGGNNTQLGSLKTNLASHEVEELIEHAGNLLTGPGGVLERRPEQREIMALFESGLLLLSKFHIDDPHISSFVGLLRRKGMTVDVVATDLGLISKCYDERDEGVGDGVVKADDEATSMQKDIIKFIGECARMKASDAHIVVDQTSTRVRLRVHGILRDLVEWRSAYGSDFCAAAFAMADASDASYQPYEYQAARISDSSVRLPAGVQALRLQFNPLSYGGRHLVMRFLYRSSGNVGDVDTLGYAQKQINQIKRIRATPMGINIVAGPTGSGKSTTLQRILTTLMRERKNEISVFTVEDPPEYVIAGAQQMPVTNASTAEERKEKFNAAIRAALRSDPDVIMIGEIRDHESAKLAFEAAMTGHQVWATLHAVDCLTIISRLKDIGVDEYKLFDPAVFTGLIGQRLLRALCNNCKIPVMQARNEGEIKDDLWERIINVFGRDLDGIFHQGKGCSACGNSGCKGRSVVAEVLLPDDPFMEQMRAENKVGAKRYWVDNLNGLTMLGHGILKASAGEVSPEEVERMLGLLELDKVRAPTTG